MAEPTIDDLPSQEVPYEIEELFTQVALYYGKDAIEDEDAGLRFQYLLGIVDREGVEAIVHRASRLKKLIENGSFVP